MAKFSFPDKQSNFLRSGAENDGPVLIIPVTGELQKGAGSESWVAENECVFYTIRYFLKFRKRDRPGAPEAGRVEIELGGGKGIKETRKETVEIEIVEKNTSSAFREYFVNSEELATASAATASDILKLPTKFNLSGAI